VVKDESPSVLCQEDLDPGIIDHEGILKPGEVCSDQLGLIGECQGRSVIIEGVDIEVSSDERAVYIVEFPNRGILSIFLE